MSILTRVDTGERSEYIFHKDVSNDIDIFVNQRGGDDNLAKPYVDIRGRGVTAIRRLAESHAQLRRFFDAMRVLGIYDIHGRLTRIIEPDECDTDEESAAMELVREIMEEIADFEGLQD